MSLQSVFDVLKIKRTELIGESKNTISAFLQNPDNEDDELPPDSDETAPVDWWQHYGFISRPPEDAETLIARVGANVFGLASRALSAAKAFGKLSVGDVALYTLGGALLKLAAKGSMTFLVPCGNKQTVVHVSHEDGSIKGVVPPGLAFEISPKNGILLNAGQGDITLSGGAINIVGNQCNINTGSVKLGMQGVRPLGWCTAGVAGAFASVPVPNIFV